MLTEKKNENLSTDEFLNKRKQQDLDNEVKRSKVKIILLSIFLCSIVGSFIYFILPVSNVSKIDIIGNVYIRDEDILELSGLSENSKYIFVLPNNVSSKIKKNELIISCEVTKNDDRSIDIVVVEKKLIGYAYEEEKNVLIIEDDSRVVLNKDNLYLIEKVPLIEGFSKEDIVLIEKELFDVDYKMINEISEMHYYPELKYQSVELIMRDGNYIFTSAYGLKLINKYYSIDSSVSSKRNNCYYFEDISGNAYMSACPWEKVVEEEIIEEQ